MEINYTLDDLDERVLEAADSTGMVKLRIAPTVYDAKEQNYQTWKNVSWTLSCRAGEALELREALRVFFAVVGKVGPRKVRDVLETAA